MYSPNKLELAKVYSYSETWCETTDVRFPAHETVNDKTSIDELKDFHSDALPIKEFD